MFSEITKSQQRMWKMTIAVIAQSGSRFWSRHILVSGLTKNFRTQTVPRRFYRLQK